MDDLSPAPRLEPIVPGIRRFAVRTPTLPPATHTNVYVAGEQALTVFDPASPWEDEQASLLAALDATGAPVERLVLTHHHDDHVSGAMALQAALRGRGLHVPIAAHPVTARLLSGTVAVDVSLEDGDLLQADGVSLVVRFTPGHAPGHLVFHDRDSGAVVAGDLVAGEGTILIDPAEGDLGDYLRSLERVAQDGPRVLLPSHGPALEPADAVLAYYVAHRHQRTQQIRDALAALGPSAPEALADQVYEGHPPPVRMLGAIQIRAHLAWLVAQGEVDEGPGDAFALAAG